MLLDPHPDVIRRCLANPRSSRTTSSGSPRDGPVVPRCSAEIARSPWVHRPRVRMALVMNPATPLEVVVRLAGLLLRPELTMAARSPAVPAPVRAMCLEHLDRRPPVREPDPSEPDLQ